MATPSNRNLANLGSAIDSGAIGEFLTVDDSGGLFRELQYSEILSRPTTLDSSKASALVDSAYIQARQTDVGLDSALITQLVDSSYVQARASVTGLDSASIINIVDSAYLLARGGGGLDSAGVTNLVDSSYVAVKSGVGSGFETHLFFATDGQTTFSGSDYDGGTLSYTENGIIVWLNGIQLNETVDYAATTGTSVVLTTGADSGSSLIVGKWSLGSSDAGGGAWGVTGLFGGGWGGDFWANTGSASNRIDYITVASPGNATDFGDLTVARHLTAGETDGTQVLWVAGHGVYQYGTPYNTMDYVTVASTGNASDFGDFTSTAWGCTCAGDGTKAVIVQGLYGNGLHYVTMATPGNSQDFGSLANGSGVRTGGAHSDGTYGINMGDWSPVGFIDRWVMATTGNATDFGDCYDPAYLCSACGDGTRMVQCGGYSATDVLQYITMATPGNSQDFGDLNQGGALSASCEDGTYGVVGGRDAQTSNMTVMDYFTVQTTGNASDFGDLSQGRSGAGSASGT